MAVSSLGNTSRILGMSSGLDTESIISGLMQAEKLKSKKIYQQKTLLEWDKTAQQDIRSLITAFRNKTMSVLAPETNMYSSSAYNVLKVTMPQTSSAVKITTGETATAGQHQIDFITRIASGANTKSTGNVTTSGTLNVNTTLENLSLEIPLQFGGTGSDTISFDLNGENFIFKKTDTLQTVMNTVNYNSKAGARLSYSELTNRFSLQSAATGAATKVDIVNNLGNLFGTGSAIKIEEATIQNGQDALLQIDGVEVTRSSNNFSIDGINYSLLASTTTPVSYRVEQDVTETVDRIKAFVKSYNELVTTLQAKVDEEVNASYTPLTDEEKENMTEKEIELWETKAKSGHFHNDRSLTNLLSGMRQMFFDSVSGLDKSLSQIGFSTGTYKDKGKIFLDETKLKSALTENPTLVSQLFTKSGTSTDKVTKYKESGLIPKLIEQFSNFNGLFKVSTANEEISKASAKITAMNTKLTNKEDYYYKKFAAMEQALSSMKSQTAWLTNSSSN